MAKQILGGLDWYGDDVALQLTMATERGLEAVAFRLEAQAKLNIIENDQIDTGFMSNSTYTVTASGSSYGEVSPGSFTDKSGVLAPPAELPKQYAALVAVGANYAIFQEQQNAFLYPALLQVANEAGGIIEKVATKNA